MLQLHTTHQNQYNLPFKTLDFSRLKPKKDEKLYRCSYNYVTLITMMLR
ncbi:hypothetical protein [Flavobacterium undicola]|nr:hypothetical protein [Flavobacterium undicola]MBA0884499.1 hypothetical protein [Flavobacterium undicola]